MPFSCAASSASATCRAISSASRNGSAGALPAPAPIRSGQRFSLHQFQHQRADAAGFLDAVDRGDVGMIEGRKNARFPFEARQPIGIGGEPRRQDFYRDVAIEAHVAGPVHLTL